MERTRLGSNPLFLFAFQTPQSVSQPAEVRVAFKKTFLQYVSDDTANRFGKAGPSATSVFRYILIMSHGRVQIELET